MLTKIRRSSELSDVALPPPPYKLRKTQSLCLGRHEFLFGDTSKQAALDIHGQFTTIPCFDSKEDTLKRISPQTLQRVLHGEFQPTYDQLIIVDCRFPYEYAGGHIEGAVNLSTKDELENHLLENFDFNKRTVIIFHCEYSSQRGPRMALHLRSRDRELNSMDYPNLYFPQLYILDGGYRSFYSQVKEFCVPQSYIEMNDEGYLSECKSRMMQFKESFTSRRNKQRSSSLTHSTSSPQTGIFFGSRHFLQQHTI
ncbi:Rhodanese-like protein [Basidiobolus meristosporus CBS 931.73]|uniref:M-phase inducer phosphatase n=1 Tax=Basidiobolus meristosporus CBS 931.73 TaxID=1314790 RepID=A0A1Y1Z1K1_9FUNG|nr:Rhodanese-like protein [Basidiobolus meristosporus CBS 931.73]|eukprot:ORY04162.1 Rhodanese-like protein [Basidiobolus meristosporus CBS 931.73]